MPDIIFKVGPDIDFKPVVSEARKKEKELIWAIGRKLVGVLSRFLSF